jgi:hypothetical protein
MKSKIIMNNREFLNFIIFGPQEFEKKTLFLSNF